MLFCWRGGGYLWMEFWGQCFVLSTGADFNFDPGVESSINLEPEHIEGKGA